MPHIILPRTVIVLGLVSFLNDVASEMITPLLPIFLTATLAGGPAVVGLVEGVAEATSSLLKLVSGRLVDRGWPAKRLMIGGYSVSNGARPMIGLALGWGWVLLLRFLDRVGKGLRTSPRDAMIAGSTVSYLRGKAFGFQRALDHAGAVVGPLLAFVLLGLCIELQHAFLLSVVPGMFVVLLLAFGLPTQSGGTVPVQHASPLAWNKLDNRVQALIAATGSLALATIPEVFLVLWAHSKGLKVVWVPLLWAAASAVKAVIALPGGLWSDRFGRIPVLAAGWIMRILALLALGLVETGGSTVWVLFLTYSGSLAFTEGAERALIGDFAPLGQRATAFGLYHMVVGLLALPGAVVFGMLWQWLGQSTAFLVAATLNTLSVAILLCVAGRGKRR